MDPKKSLPEQMECVLADEYQFYEQMVPLSEEQLVLLEETEPNVERIARLMGKKMELVEVIRHLEEEHREVRIAWEKHHTIYPPEEREGLSHWKEALALLLERLQEMEDRIEIELKRCEVEVSRELRRLHLDRMKNRAYFRLEFSPPRYIDKIK